MEAWEKMKAPVSVTVLTRREKGLWHHAPLSGKASKKMFGIFVMPDFKHTQNPDSLRTPHTQVVMELWPTFYLCQKRLIVIADYAF